MKLQSDAHQILRSCTILHLIVNGKNTRLISPWIHNHRITGIIILSYINMKLCFLSKVQMSHIHQRSHQIDGLDLLHRRKPKWLALWYAKLVNP